MPPSSPNTLSPARRHLRGVAHALLVAARGVDERVGLLGQRDLRGLHDRARRDGVRDVRVHLEVDVRPAARVAGRVDRREAHGAGRVGLLHPAQVVLVLDAAAVERVAAVAVAVPEVDAGADERAAGRGIPHRERDRERHALGDRRRRAEARADVAAHDARVVEHVHAVRPVARVGPAGLVGHLGDGAGCRGGRRRRRGRARRASPRPRRSPSGSSRARRTRRAARSRRCRRRARARDGGRRACGCRRRDRGGPRRSRCRARRSSGGPLPWCAPSGWSRPA